MINISRLVATLIAKEITEEKHLIVFDQIPMQALRDRISSKLGDKSKSKDKDKEKEKEKDSSTTKSSSIVDQAGALPSATAATNPSNIHIQSAEKGS